MGLLNIKVTAPAPLLYSVSHAADKLGLSLAQANRRVRAGSIPSIDAGTSTGRAKGRVRASLVDATVAPETSLAYAVSLTTAAALMDVSHDHMRRLLIAGELDAFDAGVTRPKARILLSDLSRWIDQRDAFRARTGGHAAPHAIGAVSIAGAARLLDVSDDHVRLLVGTRGLRLAAGDGPKRINVAELRRWMKTREPMTWAMEQAA
jgi:hypothetical protein